MDVNNQPSSRWIWRAMTRPLGIMVAAGIVAITGFLLVLATQQSSRKKQAEDQVVSAPADSYEYEGKTSPLDKAGEGLTPETARSDVVSPKKNVGPIKMVKKSRKELQKKKIVVGKSVPVVQSKKGAQAKKHVVKSLANEVKPVKASGRKIVAKKKLNQLKSEVSTPTSPHFEIVDHQNKVYIRELVTSGSNKHRLRFKLLSPDNQLHFKNWLKMTQQPDSFLVCIESGVNPNLSLDFSLEILPGRDGAQLGEGKVNRVQVLNIKETTPQQRACFIDAFKKARLHSLGQPITMKIRLSAK